VYQLGVLALQMLTGRTRVAQAAPQLAPSRFVPANRASIDAIVLRALREDPDQRFATATEFGAALRAAVEEPAASVQTRSTIALSLEARGGGQLEPLDLEPMFDDARARFARCGFVAGITVANAVMLLCPDDAAARAATVAQVQAIVDE